MSLRHSRRADPWRFTCPRGHRSIEPTNSHFWCHQCARIEKQGADIEPEFWEAIDAKTGERVGRDELEL